MRATNHNPNQHHPNNSNFKGNLASSSDSMVARKEIAESITSLSGAVVRNSGLKRDERPELYRFHDQDGEEDELDPVKIDC